jgi:pimeloyl-ACP methyl ester carboxylesterase
MKFSHSLPLLLCILTPFCQQLSAREPQLTTIFAHGVMGNKYNVLWYAPPGTPSGWHIIETPYHAFDFPDVPNSRKGVPIISNLNIGQDLDIKTLTENVQKIIATRCTEPEDGIILFGYSRGAITIFNFLSLLSMQPNNLYYTIISLTPAERAHIRHCIKAVILEAPINNPQEFAESMHKLLSTSTSWALWAASWVPGKHRLFQSLSSYDPLGIHPISVYQDVDKNIPILFVHSKNDEINAIEGSRYLFDRLKSTNHKVYFLKLNDGKHVKYNIGKSAEEYQTGVHAFYKHLGLPHDEKLATAGMNHLEY